MQISGIHHIALVTANFEAMRRFYTETLGLPVVGAFEGHPIIFLGAGSATIELIGRDAAPASQVGAFAHLALTVPDTDAAHAELVAKGVQFHVPPRDFPNPPEIRLAFFRDPDGNELELVQALGPNLFPQRGMPA